MHEFSFMSNYLILEIMEITIQLLESQNLGIRTYLVWGISFQIFLYKAQRLSLEKRKNIHFVVSRILGIFGYV